MKVFAIRDKVNNKVIDLGYFFYYDNLNQCCIELNSDVDYWDMPFVLDYFIENCNYSVDEYHTRMFVQQRVIPPDRQNIVNILIENNMEEYDEIKLFIISDGRCAQDDCYIKRISYDSLPENIKQRRNHYFSGFHYITDDQVVISYVDGIVKYYHLEGVYSDNEKISRLLRYSHLIENSMICGGGTSLSLGNGICLSYEHLYDEGENYKLNMDVIMSLALSNMMTTKDVMEVLNCTRQNVNDLVKRGKLLPITTNSRDMFFRRDEVLKRV